MAAKKKAAPAPTISAADLRLALRDAVVRLGKPTSPTELKKALPKPYQRPADEIDGLLADLAREGTLFAVKDGKGFRYTDRDPASVLAPAVQEALRDGPLDKKQLEARIKRAAPGFDKLLPSVLTVEVARGAVREHPKVGKQPLRYGLLPPDPAPFLVKALAEIAAVAKKLAPLGVTKAAIHAAIGRALMPQAAPDPRADEAAVRDAVRELTSREPPGALLSVRRLRALVSLDKPRFDGAVLRRGRAGELVLHHHDFPESLPEEERAALVADEHGVRYVGVALRAGGGVP
jgi:hypothetical protein